MKNKVLYSIIISAAFTISAHRADAQGMALNTTGAPADLSAMLDLSSNTQGMLVPRMNTSQRTSINAPATGLLVYQTDGTTGFYYYTGSAWVSISNSASAWSTSGNTLAGTGTFGTISNDHVNLMSDNLVRGRLTNLGEFFIGAVSTSTTGDLMGAVGNATFPWACNGYSSNNGGGVYGEIIAGTTTFGGVQGENNSTSTGVANACGVAGVYNGASSGTGFVKATSTGPEAGVVGRIGNVSSPYSFGVYGSESSIVTKVGGVFGNDFGIAEGALGYYASNGVDYAFYGFGSAYQIGTAAGKLLPGQSTPYSTNTSAANTEIGMGISGGVMGGWVSGDIYGMHVKGDRYSLYVDGKTYTNAPIVQLATADNGSRIATYVPSAASADVYARGKGQLSSGSVYISFPPDFKQLFSTPDELTIIVTPRGNSQGVYVSAVDANGFQVIENNNGQSAVAFNWVASGTRKGFELPATSPEILDKNFDDNVRGIMVDEDNPLSSSKHLWWDGTNVRWDAPPARKANPDFDPGLRQGKATRQESANPTSAISTEKQ